MEHYRTVKYLEQSIKGIALWKVERTETPEPTYKATIYFPTLNVEVKAEATLAKIRSWKKQTLRRYEFFVQHEDQLCRAHVFKSIFTIPGIHELIKDAKLAQQN